MDAKQMGSSIVGIPNYELGKFLNHAILHMTGMRVSKTGVPGERAESSAIIDTKRQFVIVKRTREMIVLLHRSVVIRQRLSYSREFGFATNTGAIDQTTFIFAILPSSYHSHHVSKHYANKETVKEVKHLLFTKF